jgi:hypothetical protein
MTQIEFYINNFKSLSTQNFFNIFDNKIIGSGACTVVLPLVNNTKVLIFSCDPLKRLYNLIDNPYLPKYELIESDIIKDADNDLSFNVYLTDKLTPINVFGDKYYNTTKLLTNIDNALTEEDKYLRFEYYEDKYLPAIKAIDNDIYNALLLLYNKAKLYQHDFFFDINVGNLMIYGNQLILNDCIANVELCYISYNLKIWGKDNH